MAKPKSKRPAEGPRGPMFRTYPDINGVDTSCNSHSAHDYDPRYAKHTTIMSRRTDGGYQTTGMDEGLAGGVRQQVLTQTGQRNGNMSFRSLIGREKR